jgi:hypothetical protein
MKLLLHKTGILSLLLFLGCWSFGQASAEEMTWASKCSSFGELKPNQNPPQQHINCLLTNAAIEANIPPEVVKAVAEQESSGWKQFNSDGTPLVSPDGGIGIMQITNQLNYDQERLKTDITYNIQAGVELLNKNFYERKDLPKIKGAGPGVIENWYFPVMAYNGIKPVNSPLYRENGERNLKAYQEKVFAKIEADYFIKLADFSFKRADFIYETDSNKNIIFNKMEYIITTQMHASSHLFQTGDLVETTTKGNLRSQPNSGDGLNILQSLAPNTTLYIDGNFVYDQYNSSNRFVWYPVKTTDGKTGYVASHFIIEKLSAPDVNAVNDRDVTLTGKAPFSNVMVQIMNGAVEVGSGVAAANGDFNVRIPAQTAGTELTVTYKDQWNRVSEPKRIAVQKFVQNGWVIQNGNKYYYINGVLKTGWLLQWKSWYYFDANGVLKTGWLKDGGVWYYLDANGVMQTGWVKDGSWYYLSASGAMKTGWLKDAGSWYYLSASGAMKTGWLKEGSSWYYLAGSGEMKTGWQKINGYWYYFYSSGVMAHSTTIGGYRLGSSGAMM